MENVLNKLAMLRDEMRMRNNRNVANELEEVMDRLEALRDKLP